MFSCALLLLLLSNRPAGTEEVFDANLEPGHFKQDYDSMEEVRGHQNETENSGERINALFPNAEKPAEDEHLIKEAILDVAYYLRRFKFSGHDPRRLPEGEAPAQKLFAEFPSPPLTNIHWEVKKNCEPSFVECVKYLQEQISQTVLPRRLDSLTITKQNGWSFITDRDLIKAADDECLNLLRKDEQTFEVFFEPVQRFQWLTSALYYMCLYTMKEVPYLRTFTEECDNYASCVHWDLGNNNRDVRGDNGQPFACAFYSFCPDPCCPLLYLPDWSACHEESPCPGNSSADRTCSFSRKANTDLDSLMLNRWNISCNCDEPGMRWESKSGMCVDIDECVEKESPCNYPSETCRNLAGGYKCTCSALGYRSNPETQGCEEDPVLQQIFYPPRCTVQNETAPQPVKFTDRIWNFLLRVKYFLMAALAEVRAELNDSEDS